MGRDVATDGRTLGRRVGLATATALVALVVAGCSSSARVTSTPSPTPTRSAPASVSAGCPSPDGGVCIGALQVGRSYTTTLFKPAISYSVPDPGWSNLEDLQGNFLLLPPKNTLDGVNAGTSDFIGVYASIAAERFMHRPSCATGSVPEVGNTPRAFATWLRSQPSVKATAPVAVNVGGLHGLRVDLELKPGATVPQCTDDQTGEHVRFLPILIGEGASSLDHGLIPQLTMRLYLLDHAQGVLGIEVDDIATAPGTLMSLSAVAEQLRFTGG